MVTGLFCVFCVFCDYCCAVCCVACLFVICYDVVVVGFICCLLFVMMFRFVILFIWVEFGFS